MTGADYLALLPLVAPEIALVLTGLAVLLVDLSIMRGEPVPQRNLMAAAITALGGILALLWLFNVPGQASVAHGIFVVDALTQWVKMAVLIMTLFTAGLSTGQRFTEHVGEYFSLLLMATVGMMFLVSTEDLLMLFVALELTSLSLYILTAFNHREAKSAEAGLKYFLFGSVAAAFALFGFSLLYGVAGSTNLREIAAAVTGRPLDPMFLAGMVMAIIGFGFKIAAVPFHLWAPDTYEGAPTPAAALIASGSKVASFFVLAKVLVLGFAGAEGNGGWRLFAPGWAPLLATLAVASLLLGNLAAIAQSGLKRLLAYSAVAHAGYLLLGVLALVEPAQRTTAFASVLYYLFTYGLTTIGAFGVVAVIERQTGGDRLDAFAGLGQRSPGLALCLLIFLLSLAGIPPLAGFFGKFYLFLAAARVGAGQFHLLWLVILAIAMSTVSLYYYLRVLKQAWVIGPAPSQATPAPTLLERVLLWALALTVLGLGLAPTLLLDRLIAAIKAAGF
ncbi:MAG: NADH-quinone oxidoreductase subunit N [Limisphaerales bacterium]